MIAQNNSAKQEIHLNKLLSLIKTFPKKPGCYLMKNSAQKVIYVGKAKNLKNRVTSYFTNLGTQSVKTNFLVSNIKTIEYILTNSEKEALILENNLIKQYLPRYNILLKDDKSFPYLQIDFNEVFPILKYIRRPIPKKNKKLFGPYPSSYNLKETIRILTKFFQLRDCSLTEFRSRKNACILHQMHQCMGPCVELITKEKYLNELKKVESFFSSKKGSINVINLIEEKMHDCAQKEEFEKAATFRDYLFTLNAFHEQRAKQSVELIDENKNIDVFGFYFGETEVDMCVYLLRDGILIGQKSYYFFKSPLWEEENIVKKNLITHYYQNTNDVSTPQIVCFDGNKENYQELKIDLAALFNQEKISVKNKKFKNLINTANEMSFENQRIRNENSSSIYTGLNQLKDILSMNYMPRSLECYDIAIWQGKSPTASCIRFYDGKPDKTKYRYYHLEERVEGNNDYEMLKEALNRRLKSENYPDVFIVDGGKGQRNVFQKVLDDLKINIPVLSIAKEKNLKNKKTQERIFIHNRSNPIYLEKYPLLFKLITTMRDESHRFSRKLHHHKEKNRLLSSFVDELKGINPIIKKQILKNLDVPLNELKRLNLNDLIEKFNLKKNHAIILLEYLHDKID